MSKRELPVPTPVQERPYVAITTPEYEAIMTELISQGSRLARIEAKAGILGDVNTVAGVAVYLKASEQMVRKFIHEKKLTAVKIGADYRITSHAVLEFISKGGSKS